jgi:signal transduction histidine kinase
MAMRPLDRLPSIRAKLGSVIVFAVAVTILIMYVTIGFAFRRYERDREFRELFLEARSVAEFGFNAGGRPTPALLKSIQGKEANLVLVDGSGQRLAGSLPVPATVDRVLTQDAPFDTGMQAGEEYVGVPVSRNGRVVGAVYRAHAVEGSGFLGAVTATARFVRTVWWQLLLAGAISAVIALGLARILARGMTQPLRDIAGAATRVARGDYRQRVSITSRDEVGRLAESFNSMAGEMEAVERLRRELVANVSHELKTPISALRARLENMVDGVEPADRDTLTLMLSQTERLSRLVDQLLDLSRLESGDVHMAREPVLLGPLVDRVLSEVRLARPQAGLDVTCDLASSLPPLEGDRERIHQVLFNLLDNAFRFTPAGGRVAVRATEDREGVLVEVSDTGPGIPPEHLPHVFERFYRVDRSRSRTDGGTGIGLAIARSVVEAHRGRIWARSDTGRGSTFSFVVPSSKERLPAASSGATRGAGAVADGADREAGAGATAGSGEGRAAGDRGIKPATAATRGRVKEDV